MTNETALTAKQIETKAKQAARENGWKFKTSARYWVHADHATFDGTARELCQHYHIHIISNGELVDDE